MMSVWNDLAEDVAASLGDDICFPFGVVLQGDEDDDEVIFSCRLDNAKAITTILSCLSHGNRKDQQAQCEVKQSMGRLYIGATMF